MVTRYVVVLPYVYEPYFEACVATVKIPRENILLVDNTKTNLGIMRSHNLGVERMFETGADWLIIMSAAIRFGERGGLDFIEVLEQHPDHHVIHGATANVIGGLQQKPEGADQINGVWGWHLTAFHRSVFETIGVWDESFSPYGGDDIDLSLRIRKGIKDVVWNTYPVDVTDTTMSHSINLGGVKSAFPPRDSYMRRKWGRGTGDWQNDGYEHPFNDPTKPLSYWPRPDDPLSIHNVEFASGKWKYDD